MTNPSASDQEDWYLVGKPRAECLVHWQQSGEFEAYSDADWRGDNVNQLSVSAGVIVRGGHCLKVWTKKQQVVSLSTAGCELYAAVKGIGNSERGEGPGHCMWVELTSGHKKSSRRRWVRA